MTKFEQMSQTCGNAQISAVDRNGLLAKTLNEIAKRGNDAEVRTCKEGIKILEVTKRVAMIIPKG
jgi:hypothetical protein